jgi:hypothetical protein
MKRTAEYLAWVREKMPVGSAVALDRFTTINPHWQGAGWDDCLATLIDSDSHIDLVEPLYEATKDTPHDFRLVEAVGITLLYSDMDFAAADTDTRATMVFQTIAMLS